jgi:hypothetical protein
MTHHGAGNEWRKALATDLRGFSRILLCGSYSDLGLSVGIRVDSWLIVGGRLVIFLRYQGYLLPLRDAVHTLEVAV